MTPEQRLRYLDAMGIQAWLPNDGASVPVGEPAEALPESAEAAPAAASAPEPPRPAAAAPSPPSQPLHAEAPPPPAFDEPPPFDDEPPPWTEVPGYFEEPPPELLPELPNPPAAAPQAPGPAPAPMGRRSVGEGVDWAALEAMVRDCTRCELHRSRTHPVFGVGDRNARWMVVGEAPGRDEDLQGEPFVGRAGKLLNAMLAAAGFQREQVYIANILKSRPPENRDPHADEVAACIPYLLRQIELVRPKGILAVGRIAAQNLLESDLAIGKLRGRVHTLQPYGIPVIATYHPAYLLRTPSQKRRAWDDLKLALRVFNAE